MNVYIQQYLSYVVPTSTKHLEPLQKIFADLQEDTVAYIKTQYTVGSILSMLGGKLGGRYIQDVLGKTDDIVVKHTAQAFTQLQTGTSQLAVLLGQNLHQAQQNTTNKTFSKLPVNKQFISRLSKQQDINGYEMNPDEDSQTDEENMTNEGEKGEKHDEAVRIQSQNDQMDEDALNKLRVNGPGSPKEDESVQMTASEAMFLVGPHLTKLLSTFQQHHLTKSIHPMVESTLYDQIPTTISQRGKKAVNTAVSLGLTGLGIVGASVAAFPEPTIMLTGLCLLLSGFAWFPIQRAALRRDIVKQLEQLHDQIAKKVQQELNHDSNECVIRINAMISQLESSLNQEHAVISATLTQLNTLHRDIGQFEGTIHNIDEKEAAQNNKV